MKHLDLFSGIGGFALAARWMNWETVQFVEIDKFCQKVLQKNFPNVPIHDDIKTFSGKELRGTVDILTGGFPCQPYSLAGKRKGKEDSRHLWPEMLRVIGEVQPTWIVGENVYGFVNWSGGLVFEEVQADLENKGYEVQSFILPACGINAPHRRDRVWIVAHALDSGHRINGRQNEKTNGLQKKYRETVRAGMSDGTDSPHAATNAMSTQRERKISGMESVAIDGVTAHPNSNERCEGRMHAQGQQEAEGHLSTLHAQPGGYWENFPTQSGLCRRDDAIPNRLDRIKSLGNAIVPGVAYEIFKAISGVC
jgi:DNA (cytosine-5)-methyltransferase 1